MKALIAALICFAAPLAAQSTHRMASDDCTALFPGGAGDHDDASVRVDARGWCVLRNVPGTFEIGELRLRMPQATAFVDEGLLPPNASVRLKDITPAFDHNELDSALFRSVFTRRNAVFSGALDYRWTAGRQRLTLTEAVISEGDNNVFRLTGIVEKLDLTDRAAMVSSIPEVRLSELTLQTQTDGTFSAAALVSIVKLFVSNIVPSSGHEAVSKAMVLDAIPLVPVDVLAPEDSAALTAFVEAWPFPDGTLDLKLRSERGITAPRVIAMVGGGFDDVADLFGFFPDVSIKVSWTPTP